MKLAEALKVDTPMLFSMEGYAPNVLNELKIEVLEEIDEATTEVIGGKIDKLEKPHKKK
jgi:hypothetical protein